MRKKISAATASAALLAFRAGTVFATHCGEGVPHDETGGCPGGTVGNPLGQSIFGFQIDSAFAVVNLVFNAILAVVGAIALIYLALGGIQYITSGGDSKQVEAARNKITSALMGLGVVLLAWVIIGVVGRIFGKSLLSIPF